MSEEVHKEINDPWRLLSLMLNNMCWCTSTSWQTFIRYTFKIGLKILLIMHAETHIKSLELVMFLKEVSYAHQAYCTFFI